MIKSMKKTSVLVVALMMLLSLTVAYATNVPANITIYKDGATTTTSATSMSNKAIVPGSQELDVTGDIATLTFKTQTFYKWFIPGNMISLSVDFNGDGNYTAASFSGDTVTINFPASELEDGNNFYPAKVKSDVVGITIPTSNVEFCITKNNQQN
ncbi:MAG: hypothetical protein N4A64_08555 [Marinisporobacter sp.]|jgi:hypothetical protein|nr:hypothetical protein [Marinisporobacter sp.]